MKTVAEVLNSATLGDVLSDGKRSWKVTDLDFDGCIIAMPTKFPKKESKFELWSHGVESVAIIPNLKIVKGKNK